MVTALKNEQALAQFQTYLLAERRVSKNTYDAYMGDINQFFKYLDQESMAISECDVHGVKAFIRSLSKQNVKSRSQARKVSSLKLLYSYLHERFGFTNIGELLTPPKIERTLPTYLNEEETTLLLECSQRDDTPKGFRNALILQLLYTTGMRISELINLRVEQLHFDTGYIQVNGKGNKQRNIPVPENTLLTLRMYLDEIYELTLPKGSQGIQKNYLFPVVRKGKVAPITRQSCFLFVKKMLAMAGIKKNISPHSLRHSLATHMLKNGADIRTLQVLLGHEKVSTVEIYTHLEKRQLRHVYDENHPRS